MVVRRFVPGLFVLALLSAGVAVWYYYGNSRTSSVTETPEEVVAGDWLTHLYSQNPRVAEEATRQVKALGAEAVPEIQSVLRDPAADPQRTKAAMKAAGLLGPDAAGAIPDLAEHLPDPRFTAEAAVALSFMGRQAFAPLQEALQSDDPVVRREALRSLGKLRERAPLDARAIVPLLVEGLDDPEVGVRTVAATYLGILGAEGETVVPVLIGALKDPEPDVRSAAATALGSFPAAAPAVIPALRRATGDKNADVAREAGTALVKLQGSGSK